MSKGLDNFHSCFVYRVLRPDEDFDTHLLCCDIMSNRTLDQHVENGLTVPSHFISTTSSLLNAIKWMNTSNQKCLMRYFNRRSVIVKINVTTVKLKYPNIAASAYDLTNATNRNYFLKTERQRSFSAAYSELVFSVIIPKEAVSVEFIVGIGNVGEGTQTGYSLFSDAGLSQSLLSVSNPLLALLSSQAGDEELDFSSLFIESNHSSPLSPSTNIARRDSTQTSTVTPNLSPAGHTPFSDLFYPTDATTSNRELHPTSSVLNQPSDSSGSSHKGNPDQKST